jgi:putative MATE family efflux protein
MEEYNDTQDLLYGNLKRNLIKMSVPTMLAFLFQSVYDLIDIFWIGKISSEAVAGVTIFSTIFWLVEILNEIIGTSSISLISQAYGAGDDEKTRVTVEQTVVFKAIVAIIAAVIMLIIIKPLLGFFSSDSKVLKSALDFGYIRIFFLPIMFSSYTVNTALRCLGDAKSPMKIMAAASLLNMLLDPFFMFKVIPGTCISGLNLGVFGAAVATVISTIFAFILGFSLLMSGKAKLKLSFKGLFRLRWDIDKKLITIGLPSGVEMFLRNLSGLLALKFVALYGTSTLAAIGIGNKLISFAYMPLVGFNMGSSAIVGQCLGAENVDRAKETAKYATYLNICIMAVIVVLAVIFPEPIIKTFIKDPKVISKGIPMIRIVTVSLIFAAVSMGLGSVFTGSGHTMPFLFSSLISRWAVQVPFMFLVSCVFKLSSSILWFSFISADIVEMIIIVIIYRRGTWEKKRV